MNKALARRLCASADRLQSHAAFLAACEIVALRRNLPAAQIRNGPSPAETHKLIQLGKSTVRRRDGASGRVLAIEHRVMAADQAEIARIRALVAARQDALYLAATVFGRGHRSLARAAAISHKALQNALAAVEDRRSDPTVDRMLDEAELQLMGAPTCG
ncbi:protein of unknown function [Hyphomicrobium sp. 1Nfss2.1]|uniref:hypothetical protein n=1 Tax=Hyphomicrobium sp. 1Nfss2.1 TaxID=3413936 RepID=UPI003C7C7DEB